MKDRGRAIYAFDAHIKSRNGNGLRTPFRYSVALPWDIHLFTGIAGKRSNSMKEFN